MTPIDFVEGLKKLVLEASVADTVSIVRSPPGRRPAKEIVELSNWFTGLNQSDQLMIRRLLDVEARQAVFGLLAILDGSRKLEPSSGANDYFELRFVKDGVEDILCGPRGAVLHELLE